MNTPITDALWRKHDSLSPQCAADMTRLAQFLELDRAALMEALMKFMEFADSEYVPNALFEQAERALSAARANFPTE
jgi:hypothetical protein